MILWLLACGTPEPPATPEPAPAAEPPEPVVPGTEAWRVPLRAEMHQNFAFATDATYYVFRGELDKVKEKGRALTELDATGVPARWRPAFDEMQAAARTVAEAESLDAAAEAVVALGQACAGCHAAHTGPTPAVDDVVGPGWGSSEVMQKHQWGTYLMWVGVILPNDEVFQRGAQELHHEEALPAVHGYAEKAAAARDDATRGAALASFLKSCATCHTEAGVTFD